MNNILSRVFFALICNFLLGFQVVQVGQAGEIMKNNLHLNLSFPFEKEMQNLKPYTMTQFFMLNGMISQLTTLDKNGNIIGDIADKWEISDDKKNFKFYIRKNATFTNGEKLTADHVIYSMKRHIFGKSLYEKMFRQKLIGCEKFKKLTDDITGLKKISDYEVQFAFKQPVPKFIYLLSGDFSLGIVYPSKSADFGSIHLVDVNGPTSGLYKLNKINDKQIDLTVRKDHYFYDKSLPELISLYNNNYEDILKNFGSSNSNVDAIRVSASRAQILKKRISNLSLFRTNDIEALYLRPNFYSKVYKDNPEIFNVVNRYIRRTEMYKDDINTPTTQPIPVNYLGHNADLNKLTISKDEALKLLNNKKIDLKLALYKYHPEEYYQAFDEMKRQLAEINIHLIVSILEPNIISNFALKEKNPPYDLLISGLAVDHEFTDVLLQEIYHLHFTPRKKSVHKDFETLVTAMEKTLDAGQMDQLSKKASEIIVNSPIVISLVHRPSYWVIAPNFAKHVDGTFDFLFFHQIKIK